MELRTKRPSTAEPLEAVVVAMGEGNVRGGLAGFEEPTFRQPTAQLLAALGSTTTSTPPPVPELDQPWSRSWQDWDDAIVAAAVGAIQSQRSGGGGWEVTRQAVADGLPLTDRAVLLARSSSITRHTVERTCQLLFEKCGVDALYEAQCSALSVYASGRTTGLVVDCGYASSSVHFVWDGIKMNSGWRDNGKLVDKMTPVGGAALTRHLLRLLDRRREVAQYERRLSQTRLLTSLHEREGESYLSLLPAELVACVNQHALPLTAPAQVKYALPDGRLLVVDQEQIQCTEPLFRPSLLDCTVDAAHDARAPPRTATDRPAKLLPIEEEDEETGGLGALVRTVRDYGPFKMRNEMSQNVILTGGTSMFPGMAERLERALTANGGGYAVKVVQPPCRGDQAWVGGSILASLSTFQSMWVSRNHYLEQGSSAVLARCL